MKLPPRLLLLSSLPDGALAFRADRKHREIKRRIGLARFGRAMAVHSVAGARSDEFGEQVRRFRPTHLHISCHGLIDALVLEDRKGGRVMKEFPWLQALVDGSPGIAFVALEACDSAAMARRLQRAGRVTIGMSRRFDPEISDIFFAALYQSIATGLSTRAAFAAARLDLEVLTPATARTPQLFCDLAGAELVAFRPDDDVSLPVVGDGEPTRAAIAETLQFIADDVELARDRRLLEALDAHWVHGGVLLVGGAPGSGRTRLLAAWLARVAAAQWYAASRVFAWSFEQVQGRQCGSVRAFVRALADFLDDPLLADEARSEWELGRCIAQLLRRERFLLVLDGVDALPGSHTAAALEGCIHPGLVALLRGLEGAPHGLCVVTTSDLTTLPGVQHKHLPLEPLDQEDSADWSWIRGALQPSEQLEQLRRDTDGNLLALAWAARAPTKSAPRPDHHASPLTRALAMHRPEPQEQVLLAALALAGGSLDSAAVSAVVASGTATATVLPFAVLDKLVRAGLVRATRLGRVSLTHRRLARAIDEAGFTATLVAELPPDTQLGVLGPEPDQLDHHAASLPALRARLQALIQLGLGGPALHLYIKSIARHDPPREWSFLGRRLGMYAEDLELLGMFFVEPWTVLKSCIAQQSPHQRAYLLHRAALALRHVGRVRDAAAPFAAAHRLYRDLGLPERAATLANDLAETLVALGDLQEAEKWAREGVDDGRRYLGTVPHSDHALLHQARVTMSLTLATSGLVAHRLGNEQDAAQLFANAESETEAIVEMESQQGKLVESGERYIFSRSGLQYWEHLLDRIEHHNIKGETDPADELARMLDERLKAAVSWHARTGIASVSTSYHEIARARLLSARLPSAGDEREQAIDDAEAHFARALALLHRNQYIWMVPEVLAARALLRDRARDPTNAALDRQDATVLADHMGLPAPR